jgi:hypothetical protein
MNVVFQHHEFPVIRKFEFITLSLSKESKNSRSRISLSPDHCFTTPSISPLCGLIESGQYG